MRSLLLTASALIGASVLSPAQADPQYGAQYEQGSGAWQDVPPVPLNMPGQMPPQSQPPARSGWHDHADRPVRSSQDQSAVWRQSARQGQGDWRRQGDWHDQPDDRGDPRGGWHERRAERGARMPGFWMSPAYAVSNWDVYGLGRPGYGQHWVRYYDDAVLVDDRGTVIQSVDQLDWDRAASGYGRQGYAASSAYGYGARYGGQVAGPAYAPPPAVAGYATVPLVTTFSGPGYSTTTIVQAPPVVTTTTTTTTYVDEVVAHRVYRAPPRRVVHRPHHINCCCLCR